ncbi:hypothetical protein XENORESO_002949 [Xenotaenia resolanae]|uniref:Uncharacterized protein n=1 Tax=Xenotaenia resolanae TaxID=208358 RepID=A0ABV0WPM3_9TELE
MQAKRINILPPNHKQPRLKHCCSHHGHFDFEKWKTQTQQILKHDMVMGKEQGENLNKGRISRQCIMLLRALYLLLSAWVVTLLSPSATQQPVSAESVFICRSVYLCLKHKVNRFKLPAPRCPMSQQNHYCNATLNTN